MNTTLQPTTHAAGAAFDRAGADALERHDATLQGADDSARGDAMDPGLLATSGIQESAPRADAEADPAESLQQAPELSELPDGNRALVTTALADSGADPAVARDLLTLIRDPSFQAMTAPQQTAALTDAALQQTPGFQALTAGDQRLVLEALSNRAPGDTGLPAAIQSLIQSPQFEDTRDFSAAERTALLSQVRNYPDSRSVENMENLLSKQWFRDFALGDTQRALKTVAFLAQHDGGDLEIIQNTLDLFVADSAPYRFDFSESGAYGSVPYSPEDLFRINPRYIGADNNPVDTSARSALQGELRVIGHTFVHEVNHMQNWDRGLRLDTSYGFHEEYRAFYVGVKAQHGRDPSVADVIDRVAVFVNPGGGYAHLAELLAAGGQDAQEIVGYLNTLLGRDDLTIGNARAEVNGLVQLLKDTQDAGLPLPEALSRPAGVTIGPPGTNNITNE